MLQSLFILRNIDMILMFHSCGCINISCGFITVAAHWYIPMVSTLIARSMGQTWGRKDPGGPHVGPMNFAIWVDLQPNNYRMSCMLTEHNENKQCINYAHARKMCFTEERLIIRKKGFFSWYQIPHPFPSLSGGWNSMLYTKITYIEICDICSIHLCPISYRDKRRHVRLLCRK